MAASWWQQTYNFAQQVLTLMKRSDQHNIEIKELQRQVKELTAALQQVAIQMQRDRDKAEFTSQLAGKDRELLLSRLETKLLRYERNLPPPDETV